MGIGFRIVNREFLHQLERYIKLNGPVEKKNFLDVPDRIRNYAETVPFHKISTPGN